MRGGEQRCCDHRKRQPERKSDWKKPAVLKLAVVVPVSCTLVGRSPCGSSKLYAVTSTRLVPSRTMSSFSAAAYDKSIIRLCTKGPRSFTRTTILLLLRQISDTHVSRQRQCLVRGCHRVHIVNLAIGGQVAVKFLAVPGRDTALLIAGTAWHDGVGFVEHFILRSVAEVPAIAVLAARLTTRHRVARQDREYARAARTIVRLVFPPPQPARVNRDCEQQTSQRALRCIGIYLWKFSGRVDVRPVRTSRCDCIS